MKTKSENETPVTGNPVNAGTIETPPDLPEHQHGFSTIKLFSPRSRLARHLRAIATEVSLYGWDDAAESREELIRGIEMVGRMPWRHGGLNE
jgi:hypothetical protein